MEAIAKTKYLKGSPRKARLVVDLIRGRNVSQALAILKFTDKRAADPIAKCLNSAIANATYQAEQQNIAIDPDDLWVRTCFVDMGPTKNRRRMRPAPQGRAYREQRHYCHITIQVTSDEAAEDRERIERQKPQRQRRPRRLRNLKKKEGSSSKGRRKESRRKAKAEEVETSGTKRPNSRMRKITAEAADAKDAKTQNPAELNETKQADEKQLDRTSS